MAVNFSLIPVAALSDRLRCCLPVGYPFGTALPVLHLLSDAAQPVNGIVGLRELVANAQEEVELGVEIGLGGATRGSLRNSNEAV